MRTALVLVGLVLVGCSTDPDPGSSGSVDDLQPASVVRIVDGDTLRVVPSEDGPAGEAGSEIVVRLLEIDTPESVAPGQPVECFGDEASRALEELLPVGEEVWLEPDEELLDRYDRILLYVHASRGGRRFMVNRELVRQGYAEAVLFEPNDRHIASMRAAEKAARQERLGLWSAC